MSFVYYAPISESPLLEGLLYNIDCYGNQSKSGYKELPCFTPRFPWQPLQHPRVLFQSMQMSTPILTVLFYYSHVYSFCREKLPDTSHAARFRDPWLIRGWISQLWFASRSCIAGICIGLLMFTETNTGNQAWVGHIGHIGAISTTRELSPNTHLPIKENGEKAY